MPYRKKSRRVKETDLRPDRKPYDWLNRYQGRRGALQLVRQAIREGWIDDPDQRQKLVTALDRLPPMSRMQDREFAQLVWVDIEMRNANLRDINDVLEALSGEG